MKEVIILRGRVKDEREGRDLVRVKTKRENWE